MDRKISDEISVMMYDDLATLAEGVISTAIESGKKITPEPLANPQIHPLI